MEHLGYNSQKNEQLEKKIGRVILNRKKEKLNLVETNKKEELEESIESVPEGIISTYEFETQNERFSVKEIYEWYASAMSRRDRDPIDQDRFIRHFFEDGSFEQTYMYGDGGKGYVLGFFKHGIFIPTHFAPKTLRGGYGLFKELGESKTIPVVGAITQDLVETLTKLPGWKTIKLSLLAYLSSDLVKKTIVYNSCPGIRKKMFKLVKEFVMETKQIREREESRSDGNINDERDDFNDYEPEGDFEE